MQTVNFHEAKTSFRDWSTPQPAARKSSFAKAGRPAARLVPMERAKITRRFGGLKGKVRIADDFDAPLSDDVIAVFEVVV
ncbi:hypothetical protein LMG28138_01169 [Pararobbsia alpina]|uniref:Uncharacterized protein n=1 Tax=Pararobbsia alpina TaxID=621374 RepID=A0A6S7AYH7_9BURK|nr:hypothetical protein LMG28138_01169 [Pararobbsia alpina]